MKTEMTDKCINQLTAKASGDTFIGDLQASAEKHCFSQLKFQCTLENTYCITMFFFTGAEGESPSRPACSGKPVFTNTGQT